MLLGESDHELRKLVRIPHGRLSRPGNDDPSNDKTPLPLPVLFTFCNNW
jgi:hypothetical protein